MKCAAIEILLCFYFPLLIDRISNFIMFLVCSLLFLLSITFVTKIFLYNSFEFVVLLSEI